MGILAHTHGTKQIEVLMGCRQSHSIYTYLCVGRKQKMKKSFITWKALRWKGKKEKGKHMKGKKENISDDESGKNENKKFFLTFICCS